MFAFIVNNPERRFNYRHLRVSHLVGLWHGHTLLHQELDNFIVVGVCSQDDGGDVRSEVRKLFVQKNRRNLPVQREKNNKEKLYDSS